MLYGQKGNGSVYLAFELDLLLIRVGRIPLGEAGLTLPVLDQDEGEDHLRIEVAAPPLTSEVS